MIQNTGVANLRLFTLWRITFAVTASEGFFKDEANVQLCAPAEAFGEWQGQRVTVVDLGEQEGIRWIDAVAAYHTRVDVQGHQRALACAATGHNEINRFRVQQNARHDPQMDVGQVVIVFVAHPNVVDRETFLFSNGVQFLEDDGVFWRLAVFHHQCNFHSSSPECDAGHPAVNSLPVQPYY